MAEPVNGIHPDAAELQAHADGDARDERVAAHVESCAVCRDEIAAIRRVTAALSLGSKPTDSLMEKIRERRAASTQGNPVIPLRQRSRARHFVLPVALAAAVLAVFVPRALREPSPDERPSSVGTKGVMPGEVVLREMIVTETGSSSIDSVSWDFSGSGITVDLRYVEGFDESPRAELLAQRIALRLRVAGVDPAAIIVRSELAQTTDPPLPAGAVAVTVRRRLPPIP